MEASSWFASSSASLTVSLLLLRRFNGPCQLIPALDVGNPSLVAGHDDFGSLGNRTDCIAARPRTSPHACLGEHNLTGTQLTNWNGHRSQYAYHFVIRRVEMALIAHQHLSHEDEDDQRADGTNHGGDHEHKADPQARIAGQQIASPAKPRQEGSYRSEIE